MDLEIFLFNPSKNKHFICLLYELIFVSLCDDT